MTRILSILILLFSLLQARAELEITATVTVTNSAGTTNGQTFTVNSSVRTWTNAVYLPQTQIATNATQAGAAGKLITHVAAYPFNGLQLGRAVNGLTLKSNAYFSASVSAGWGLVVYSTNNPGDSWVFHVPFTVESPAQQTNLASAAGAIINSSANTNGVKFTIPATNAVFHDAFTVTNSDTGNSVTSSNGVVRAVSFASTGSGTNLIGLSTFTNVHNGHFLYQGTDGLVTNADDGQTITNLNASELRSGTVADARLSANVPLKNGSNYWSGANTVSTNQNQITPDFSMPVQLTSTNAAFNFLAPVGVDTTKKTYQRTFVFVTNTTAAAVLVGMPPNVNGTGVPYVTNVTRFEFECYAQKFTNCDAKPYY